MKKQCSKCTECGKFFTDNPEREDMFDVCDTCYPIINERVQRVFMQRHHLESVKAAVFYVNCMARTYTKADYEEAKIRAFMGSVMPEIGRQIVEELVKDVRSQY